MRDRDSAVTTAPCARVAGAQAPVKKTNSEGNSRVRRMICPELNCTEWRSRLIELSRGRLFDANERDRILSHLGDCESCTGLFEEQAALTSAEAAFASELAAISLPRELESVLLAEYVTHARSRRR